VRDIEAYECVDGAIFTDENKAKAHEDDLLGMELDVLLKLFDLNWPRMKEYKSLSSVMNQRKELLVAVKAITNILEHNEYE